MAKTKSSSRNAARETKSTLKGSTAPVILPNAPASSAVGVFTEFKNLIIITFKNYVQDYNSNLNLQIIDSFLIYLIVMGVLNFSFVLLQGTYPFNAFLSSFILCVGQFVLTISLRLQTSLENINNKVLKYKGKMKL